ncbi:HAMP domain-containing sensor histidine kinase [Sphingosinicella sp. YJ22]|uniref:sensor histidine kinase n=1 Tax=Sphingosinicella sp. YJ22 TaxID=1104780 RepID=UPI00140E315F|nr:HAMP domain-containing sensor histidine kinase [Sphingosinicella sp. YJ22]
MYKSIYRFIDWFIPSSIQESQSDRLMARTFVLLHLVGPLMGHSVTYFLSQTAAGGTWQFWATEAIVVSFLAIPLLLRVFGSLHVAAMVSVQVLVGLSLFGSFFFGGISSPLLPWFLIAMVLGFFYLADSIKLTLAGVAFQLACFVVARLAFGEFPAMIEPESLKLANTFSIVAALAYMTLLCLYYETVMRISLSLEQETIDQRGKLEALREAMQAAELASTRKSIFLAKMSHELRTPLNAVIGYAEILRETFEERADAGRKMNDLDRIHAAGRHLLALVNNVIDLSSIESSRVELSTQAVVVKSLVEEVIATASPLIAKRDNRMVVNMPEDLGALELDALKVRQCLLNLLSNAAKFTTKGTIMLTVISRPSTRGDLLVLEVSDDGIGIPSESLRRIFEDFSQADNETVNKFGGTGLGLALTKRFCQMMGGSITVRSQRGVGSNFTIEIPMVRLQRREGDVPRAA